MRTVTVVIIGAGHSGLAMSRRLTERSIDHVVLERAAIANSWRAERRPSMRLLTPNWQTSLPGRSYDGGEPDGYMTAPEVATFIEEYAGAVAAPVCTSTTVTRVRTDRGGYEVMTDRGPWRCRALVLASGPGNEVAVPAWTSALPRRIAVRTPLTYRTPDELAPGGVLVVGASASGVQLAEEIQRSGRPVTIAAGEHVRLPRTYRGRDIFWWTEAAGVLDQRSGDVDDLVRARRVPSPQLIGSQPRRSIDLGTLRRAGVTVAGRLAGIRDGVAQLSGALPNLCTLADLKMNRLLDALDDWARVTRVDADPPERFPPIRVDRPPLTLDLRRAGIATVVLATGFRPDYRWLDLPVLDHRRRIIHDGGVVTGAPGCYVLGLNLLRRRRSSYLSGASDDTAELAALLHQHLDAGARPRGRRVPCGKVAG